MQPGEYFDFQALLSEVKQDFPVAEVEFYGTYLRLDSSRPTADQLRARAHVEFLNNLRGLPGLTFHKGYYSSFGKEKGVDVQLAVDMVLGSYNNAFDQAVIMTGDDDFIYPVRVLKTQKKPIFLAALGSRFPFGMSFYVNGAVVYDINNHFSQTVRPQIKKKLRNILVRDITSKLPIKKIQQIK